jgi:hypothetical protein
MPATIHDRLVAALRARGETMVPGRSSRYTVFTRTCHETGQKIGFHFVGRAGAPARRPHRDQEHAGRGGPPGAAAGRSVRSAHAPHPRQRPTCSAIPALALLPFRATATR